MLTWLDAHFGREYVVVMGSNVVSLTFLVLNEAYKSRRQRQKERAWEIEFWRKRGQEPPDRL